MLQKLNERIQGVVAWVVIVLITITFALFGVEYYLQSRQDSNNAQAEVNGHPISKQDFDINYRRSRQAHEQSQLTAAMDTQLKQQILDQMIVNQVSMQSARSNGFEVDTSQANAAIVNIPQFQEDGHFSADRYQQALNGALFTPQSFQKEVRQGMLLNQQRFALIGTAFALPNEISRFVKLYMQTRDYDYLEIPTSLFSKADHITEADIDNFYKLHQKEFMSPEQVSVDYVQLAMADIKNSMTISDEQISRYYDENKSNFNKPAQWQVAHILFAVPDGASEEEQTQIQQRANETYKTLLENPGLFAQEVKRVSADKISALHGGELPLITAGQSDFDKALLGLTKPGEISKPIHTKHGYEIFKLMAYKPSAIKPLESVKDQIKNQLLAEQAQSKYSQLLEQISDLSYQTPDSLANVAEALKLPIQHSVPFGRQGGTTAFTQSKAVVNAAFSHDVLTLGNNSEPIQLNNEAVVVLRVNKHFPSKEKSLAEVKPIIEQKMILNQAKNMAEQFGEKLLQLGNNKGEMDKLINENHLQWKAVSHLARESDAIPAAINQMAFNLPRENAEEGHSLGNGNFVIVRLKHINDGNVDALDKEQVASITQQIEASYGMMDYDLYVSDLMSHAQVVKH